MPDPNTNQLMREAEQAWNKLLRLAPGDSKDWTESQRQQLELITEVIKKHHNAILRLMKNH